jgi:hypothetical protein
LKKYLTQRRKGAKIKNNLKKKIVTENEIAKIIVDTALQIHKRLGAGVIRIGLWGYFGAELIRDDISRVVNGL